MFVCHVLDSGHCQCNEPKTMFGLAVDGRKAKKSNKGDSQLSPGMLTSRSPIHSAIQPSSGTVVQLPGHPLPDGCPS